MSLSPPISYKIIATKRRMEIPMVKRKKHFAQNVVAMLPNRGLRTNCKEDFQDGLQRKAHLDKIELHLPTMNHSPK